MWPWPQETKQGRIQATNCPRKAPVALLDISNKPISIWLFFVSQAWKIYSVLFQPSWRCRQGRAGLRHQMEYHRVLCSQLLLRQKGQWCQTKDFHVHSQAAKPASLKRDEMDGKLGKTICSHTRSRTPVTSWNSWGSFWEEVISQN